MPRRNGSEPELPAARPRGLPSDAEGSGVQRVVLPTAPAERTRDAAPALAPRRRLLLVDDDPDFAEILAMQLERRGFDVRVAHDARTALEQGVRHRPDAAVLDLRLGDADGATLARQLRERTPHRMRILALSGRPLDARERASAVFDDALLKPARIDDILARLRDG